VSAEEQHSEQEGRVGSLYRRHRPRTFADVVGQEPVVRTLRNAIERGKVHHAYLFVGSRGTGKTSMAKILAACLNCERGPTIEPCGVCDSCRSIATATSLDVIEMDAASNNSVDDIRELRESVAYAPVSGRRKIYILDEAHMLSTAAWNAFLKTLEEPPPNTVFVLATTEANKVPATVIDRCHRFDFHRPTVEQIASVLRRAADAESIEIPPPALAAIARSATGSFRDGLGTLEQLVTYSGSSISLEDVLAVLGVADSRLLAQAVDAVAAGDARAALGALESCAAQGRDAASFAVDLEVRLRELMIVGTLGEVPAELSLTPESDAALAEQAAAIPPPVVVRLLELLGEALEAIRAGADARTRLELALVKASRPETDTSLRALLARIERLEGAGAGTVSAVAAQREVPVPAAPVRQEPAHDPSGEPVAPPAPPSREEVQASAPRETPPPPTPPPAAPSEPAPAAEIPAPPAETAPPPPAAGQPATVAGAMAGARASESGAVAYSAVAVPAPGAESAPSGEASVESFLSIWPGIVEMLRSGNNAYLAAAIERARPVKVEDMEVTIGFDGSLSKKQAERPDERIALGEALTALTANRWRISYELREDLGEAVAAEATGDGDSEERRLARFMEEFDAEDITPEARSGGEETDLPTLTGNEKGP
jgi:DNA polymerase-3 subunit gamma/tau